MNNFFEIDYDNPISPTILISDVENCLINIELMLTDRNYTFIVPKNATRESYFLTFVGGRIIINSPNQIESEILTKETQIAEKEKGKIKFTSQVFYQINISKNETFVFKKITSSEVYWV